MTTTFDKRMSIDDIIASLSDGMTIGIGGWATRRKPMALVRALARSKLKDLTVVSYGGPDVGVLAAAGKIAKLAFAFVSLDHIPIEPHFKKARQAGLKVWEMDEGMLHWGLRAAAMHLPFLPTRCGMATSVAEHPGLRTIRSPYADGEELIAMPALRLDAALLHVHRSDERGNALILSPDPFFDELMARAADRVFLSAERIVPTEELGLPGNARFHPFERAVVTGVAEAPFGAHPTSAAPDYEIDMKHLRHYVASAESDDAWNAYRAAHVDVDQAAYVASVGGADAILAAPRPVY
ncbi:acyl CoA--acetate/3-ketoacid CoA transferase subunit alpha [Sphingomonas histidinilytica]|jgi:glutaconate CoA-transferase subunit A|uniref:Glutaconate CoA-transferase subunit A n=1 Tax=Rhizorhabdus histidinilytica TaxID=439228 RepID=A0A1T5G133_9SPHN|nr:CoA-transferase [Rhizorhabdus histidinilytica]MBO9378403.1 acyl CoA--acetate/3-ketoacid CoA transferase subunit alpha [Rhizorhabdus histidinilytica]QEH81518.1 CoA transferase subunit A [Sphingomonas sp. C8-2]SKC02205.1 glutaconate CoA-transferase subunit A [Rhizorhabdus histidinilytica]